MADERPTLRDWFAVQVLAIHRTLDRDARFDYAADDAYRLADHMMRARQSISDEDAPNPFDFIL